MGLIGIANRQIATIVTHLEMTRRPLPAPIPPAPLRLAPWKQPTLDAYRALFRRVGEPWLWFSRLVLPDADVLAIIHDPAVAIYAVVDPRGIEVGMLELDFRVAGECELSFLGLVPEWTGKGHGRWLMGQAKALAWRKGVERIRVHTCTLDDPRALGFYRKSGFVPFKREIETFDDPRLLGVLPREAAPHIPLLLD
ncbi:GNAT family N-acetyltransferase [Sphingobium sp. AN641]|uniref:GNAT family N-acetyltransferase n=1 Tax=Sphingobium sp. AN641 TaxID=3133443 RepID=UPI0030BF60FD